MEGEIREGLGRREEGMSVGELTKATSLCLCVSVCVGD